MSRPSCRHLNSMPWGRCNATTLPDSDYCYYHDKLYKGTFDINYDLRRRTAHAWFIDHGGLNVTQQGYAELKQG
jgi:hypothetical protein